MIRNLLKDWTPPRGVDAINAIADGYKLYQTVCTAMDAGLFTWLADNGPADRKSITAALAMKGMYMSSFLQTLVDARLLQLADERYGLTSESRAFLLAGAPWYQGEALMALKSAHSPWSGLTRLVCEAPARADVPDGDRTARAMALHPLFGEAQAVARGLAGRARFADCESLLDLGGSHGLFAIALCQLNPALSATILASPETLERTRTFIAESGLAHRIDVREGSPLCSDLGMGHDIVIAAHALYTLRQQVEAVFRRAASALSTDGWLVSCHWFCREGCEPSSAGLRDMDKCVSAGGHPLCHIERFGGLMREAGFADVSQSDIQGLYGVAKLHVASRHSDAMAGGHRGCGC